MAASLLRPALNGRSLAGFILFLAMMLLALPAFAQAFPPLTGRVVD